MSLWKRSLGGVLITVAIGTVAVGMSVSPDSRITQGECRAVNGADLCVWAETSADTLTSFGMTVPIQAIQNAPSEAAMVWPPVPVATIPLPDVARSASGFDNVTVYWEPHGHPPAAFLAPHFDFHFYVISDSQRMAIDCADSTKPAVLPAGYSLPDMDLPDIGHLPGVCVPQMGMHALVTTALQDTVIFSSTMVMGFYKGQPIFFEPMIAKAKLLERRSFTLPMASPAGVPAGVHYPTRFEAKYDGSIPGYRFEFSGLSR